MCDLMILNIFALICSLPVITAGSTFSALYSVSLKLVRDEESFPLKDFFRAFKENFRQSLLLWLIIIALAAVIYADVSFALAAEGGIRTLYLILSGVMGVLLLILFSFSIPLSARFSNSLKGQILNSFKLALIAPGKMVGMWAVIAAFIAAAVFLPFEALAYIGWFYFLFGLSLPIYINSGILNKIFLKIEDSAKNDA